MAQNRYSQSLVQMLGNFYPCLLVITYMYVRLHPLMQNTDLATATRTCMIIYLHTLTLSIRVTA